MENLFIKKIYFTFKLLVSKTYIKTWCAYEKTEQNYVLNKNIMISVHNFLEQST